MVVLYNFPIAAFVLIYLFIFVLCFIVYKEDNVELPCRSEYPCIRFCCTTDQSACCGTGQNTCNEKYIRETLDSSLIGFYNYAKLNKTEPFHILLGAPKCSMKVANSIDDEYQISSVSGLCSIKLSSLTFSIEWGRVSQ